MKLETGSPRVAPPLKWAGGKRWQVSHVRALWEAHRGRRLVEPFCGGLAMALGLMPDEALLNDINPHVINFYCWLRRGLRVEIPLENEAGAYYAHRARFNELLAAGRGSSHESAELFYYLNRTGYNGLCRFNRRGSFNVPFGRYTTIAYVRDFAPFRAVFARWRFTSTDLEQIDFRDDDFVYADPPYDVPFRAYSKGGFSWDDQVRTAARLAHHPGPVILVNQATPRILALYRELGYDVTLLRAPRRISCTGDRTPAEEAFATRNIDSGQLTADS